jgi:arylsulfatase A-like enzyme
MFFSTDFRTGSSASRARGFAAPRLFACSLLACWRIAGVAAIALGDEPSTNPVRPNIIVLLVDDWGWTDAGCMGSDFYRTPNIDRFYSDSVRFDNGYAACTVCSPTRAALLTGMYPARLHLTNYIPGARQPAGPLKNPDWTQKLEHRYVTIAEALRDAGYHTAHVGKWHLTPYDDKQVAAYLPQTHGFDVNIGGGKTGQPGSYFYPYTRPNVSIGRLPPGGKEGEYLTDRLTDEAVKLMHQWADEPFFIYLAYYAVHTPIEPKPELRDEYAQRLKPGLRHHNPAYAAMVQSVDECVGRLREALRQLKIDDHTIIFLAGDNGGVIGKITSNYPLRSGKSDLYEGGVRVPTMIYWPGVTKGATCDEPVITVDFYPTILEMTGVEGDAAHNAKVDGVSLVPVLRDPDSSLGREAIYWHYPHYQAATPYGAVRAGPWRLIEFYEDMHVELYNLVDDIGEMHDLSAEYPDVAARLRNMLHQWRDDVGAQMPTRVPGYTSTSRRR